MRKLRILRWSLIAFCFLAIFIIGSAYVLLFTAPGARVVWNAATNFVPFIKGEFDGGAISDGIRIKNLELNLDDLPLRLSADAVDIEWDLAAMIHDRLPIKKLLVDGARMEMTFGTQTDNSEYLGYMGKKASAIWTGDDSDEFYDSLGNEIIEKIASENVLRLKEKKAAYFIDLPFSLEIKDALIRDFTFDTDIFRLSVGKLALDALWHRKSIKNADIALENVDFELLDTSADPGRSVDAPDLVKEFSKEENARKIATMATAHIPMRIGISKLAAKNVRYHQTTYDTEPIDFTLSGRIDDYTIFIDDADIDSKQYGKLSLNGKIGLTDYLPMKFAGKYECGYKILGDDLLGLKADIGVSGDLSDLSFALITKDVRKLIIHGRLGIYDPDFPYRASVSYDSLAWPLKTDAPVAKLSSGTIAAQGDLSKFSAELKSSVALEEAGYRDFQLSLAADGPYNDIDIKKLSVFAKKDKRIEDYAKLSGRVYMHDEDIEISDFGLETGGNPLKFFMKESPVENISLGFNAEAKYRASSGEVSFDIRDLAAGAGYLGKKFGAAGALKGFFNPSAADGEVEISKLTLTAPEFSAFADGKLSTLGECSVQIKANSQDLAGLTSIFMTDPITGKIDLDGKIAGKFLKPSVALKFSSENLAMKNAFSFEKITADIEENLDLASFGFSGNAVLEAKGVKTSEDGAPLEAKAELKGNQASHTLQASASQGDDLSAFIYLNGSLEKNLKYTADVQWLKLATPFGTWRAVSPFQVIADTFSSQKISFNKITVSKDNASISLKPGWVSTSNGSMDVHAVLRNFDLSMLRQYLPEDIRVFAKFNGEVTAVSDASGKKDIKAEILSKNAMVTRDGKSTRFKKLQLTANTDAARVAHAALLLDGGSYGSIEAKTDLELDSLNKNVTKELGKLTINNLDSALFEPFVSGVSVFKGKLNADVRYFGNFIQDDFYPIGSVAFNDGKVITDTELLKAEDINLRLNFDQNKTTVDGGMKIGGGDTTISGALYQSTDGVKTYLPTGHIKILGKQLVLFLNGMGQATLDAMFMANISRDTSPGASEKAVRMDVKGKVRVPDAGIVIKQIDSTALTPTGDVIVTTKAKEQESLDAAKTETEGKTPKIGIDLNVDIGPRVSLKAFGLKTMVEGSLYVGNTQDKSGQMLVKGHVDLVNGTFKSFGQNLVISRGNIAFDGAASTPSINFEAIRNPEAIKDGSGVRAGLRVVGTPSRLKMKLFSEPELSDEEKLSYIMNGTGMSESSGSQASAMAMVLNAGVGTAGGQMQGFAESVGLKDFSMESTGSEQDTQVAMSAHITDKLKISFGYGIFTAVSEVKLRYELLNQLFIQFATSTGNAIDLFYNFSF